MEQAKDITQEESAAMLDNEQSERKKPITADLNSKSFDKQSHDTQNNLDEQRNVNLTIETFEPSMNVPPPKLLDPCKPENDAKVLTTAERQNLLTEENASGQKFSCVVEEAEKHLTLDNKIPDVSEVSFNNLAFPPSESFSTKEIISINENLNKQSSTPVLCASTLNLCSSCSKIKLSAWRSEPCTSVSLLSTPDLISCSSISLPTESSIFKKEDIVTDKPHQSKDFRFLRPLDYSTCVIKEDEYEFTPWRKRAEAATTATSISIPTCKAVVKTHAKDGTHFENLETPFNVLENPQTELEAYIEIRKMLIDLTIGDAPFNNNPCSIPSFETYAYNPKADTNSMEHAGTLELYNLFTDELNQENTNPSSDENVNKFFQDEFAKMDSIASPTSLNSDVLSNPPFTYEDCEFRETGPKPINWVEVHAQREIGRPVAVFDSRDFNPKYNIEPLWLDPEFNFDAPINRNYNLYFDAQFDTPEEASLLDKYYTEEKILALKEKHISIFTPAHILQYKKEKKTKTPKKDIPKRVEVRHMREPRQSLYRPQLYHQHFQLQYQARCQAQFKPRYYCRSKYGPPYSRYRVLTNTSRKLKRRPTLPFQGTILTTIPEKRDLEEEEERKMVGEITDIKPELEPRTPSPIFLSCTNYESDPETSDGEFLFKETIIVESSNRKLLYVEKPRPPSAPLPSPFPVPSSPPLSSGIPAVETYASKLKKAISAPDVSMGAIPKPRKTRIFSRSPTSPKLAVKQCKSSPMLTEAAIKTPYPKKDFVKSEPPVYPSKPSAEQFKSGPTDNQQALPVSRRPQRKKNINVPKKKLDEKPRPPKNLKVTFSNFETTKPQARPQDTHSKNEENSSRAKKTGKGDCKSVTPEVKPISLLIPESELKLDPETSFGEPLIMEPLPESPLPSVEEPLSSSQPSSALPCSDDEPTVKQPLEDVEKADVKRKADFDTEMQEDSPIQENNLKRTLNDTDTTPKCSSPELEFRNEEISPNFQNIPEEDEQELAIIMAELIPKLEHIPLTIPSPVLNSDSESDSESSEEESLISEPDDLDLSLIQELFSSLPSSPRLPLGPIPEEFTVEASTSHQEVTDNVPDFSNVLFIQLPSSQKTPSRNRSSRSAKKQPEPLPFSADYHPRGCRRLEKLMKYKEAKKNKNPINQLAQNKDETKNVEAQVREKKRSSIFSFRFARWARKKEKSITRKYTMKVLLCSTFTFLLFLYSFTSCILCML